MARYTIEYSDCVEVEASSEDEAMSKAWDRMFCDGPKDYRMWCSSVEGEDEDGNDEDED